MHDWVFTYFNLKHHKEVVYKVGDISTHDAYREALELSRTNRCIVQAINHNDSSTDFRVGR